MKQHLECMRCCWEAALSHPPNSTIYNWSLWFGNERHRSSCWVIGSFLSVALVSLIYICLHLRGKEVDQNRPPLLIKHTGRKKKRIILRQTYPSVSFLHPHLDSVCGIKTYCILSNRLFQDYWLKWGWLFISFHFSHLTVASCVWARLYLHGNDGRGKPIITRQNLTKRFLCCLWQRTNRIPK